MYKINEKDITLVIQGKVSIIGGINITEKLIKQILVYHPEINIILSCWKGDKVTVESERLIIIYNKDPGENVTVNRYLKNLNRMIVSTYNGILKCRTKYVAEIRSDFYLIKPFDFDSIFKHSLYGSKILTCMSYGHYRLFPFYISDWFHFGHIKNLRKMWSIPLLHEKPNISLNEKKGIFYSNINETVDHVFNSEQYIAYNYLLNNEIYCCYDYYNISFTDVYNSYMYLGNLVSVISRFDLPLRSEKHKIFFNKKDLFIWSDFCSNLWPYKILGFLKLFLYYTYVKLKFKR